MSQQKKYKQHELTIDIGASSRTNIITSTTFFTMDIKTGKKVINFTLNGERFDLTDATVMLGFEFVEEEATKIIDSKDGSIVIERPRRGECSVVLPNHLYQYSGSVLVHVYIMFDDGRSFDAGIIVTEFKESWLDSQLEEMTEFYVKRFEDLAEEIRVRADRLHQILDGVDRSIVSQNEFDAHINDTNNPHDVTIGQIPNLQQELDNRALSNHAHPEQTTVTGNAGTATQLQTPRQINGTTFDGSSNITTVNWGAGRDITLGNTTRRVNGSEDVTWPLADIGAAPVNHTHNASAVNTGTLAIARIPTGTTATTVALGSHTHTIAQVTNLQTELNNRMLTSRITSTGVGASRGAYQVGNLLIQTGIVLIPGGAGTQSSLGITFPRAFNAVPNIQVSGETAVVGTNFLGVATTNITRTGFRPSVLRTNSTGTWVHWLAIGGI